MAPRVTPRVALEGVIVEVRQAAGVSAPGHKAASLRYRLDLFHHLLQENRAGRSRMGTGEYIPTRGTDGIKDFK